MIKCFLLCDSIKTEISLFDFVPIREIAGRPYKSPAIATPLFPGPADLTNHIVAALVYYETASSNMNSGRSFERYVAVFDLHSKQWCLLETGPVIVMSEFEDPKSPGYHLSLSSDGRWLVYFDRRANKVFRWDLRGWYSSEKDVTVDPLKMRWRRPKLNESLTVSASERVFYWLLER